MKLYHGSTKNIEKTLKPNKAFDRKDYTPCIYFTNKLELALLYSISPIDAYIKKNYNGEKSIGIFLVEFLGGKITICQKGIFKEFYKLSYDKDLLEYIYKFKNELKYVIFTDNEHYDVVEVKNIPDIIKSIPKEITFGVGRFTTITTTLFYE